MLTNQKLPSAETLSNCKRQSIPVSFNLKPLWTIQKRKTFVMCLCHFVSWTLWLQHLACIRQNLKWGSLKSMVRRQTRDTTDYTGAGIWEDAQTSPVRYCKENKNQWLTKSLARPKTDRKQGTQNFCVVDRCIKWYTRSLILKQTLALWPGKSYNPSSLGFCLIY